MFVITRFRYIGVFIHIFYYTWCKENPSLYQGLRYDRGSFNCIEDIKKHSEHIVKMSSVLSMVSSVFSFPLMRISSPFSSFPCTQLLKN